jgi:hypothetical protein
MWRCSRPGKTRTRNTAAVRSLGILRTTTTMRIDTTALVSLIMPQNQEVATAEPASSDRVWSSAFRRRAGNSRKNAERLARRRSSPLPKVVGNRRRGCRFKGGARLRLRCCCGRGRPRSGVFGLRRHPPAPRFRPAGRRQLGPGPRPGSWAESLGAVRSILSNPRPSHPAQAYFLPGRTLLRPRRTPSAGTPGD